MQQTNLSPLAFVTDKADWLHNQSYAYGQSAPLIASIFNPIAFQFVVPTDATSIDCSVYSSKGEYIQAVTIGVSLVDKTSYKIVKGNGAGIYATPLVEGCYYLQIEVENVGTYYSEIFKAERDLSKYTEIIWHSYEDQLYTGGGLDFSGSFSFRVYLESQIGMPAYEYEEDAEKRDGYTFINKQISEKTYKFTFAAPEYLLDAMRLIRLSDVIKIISNGREYVADTFLISPSWSKGAMVAIVQAEFQTDTILKKIGNYAPEGGEYNDEYNDDFNNIKA